MSAILDELGHTGIRRLMVFNKADAVPEERVLEILENHPGALAISAVKRGGIQALLRRMDDLLEEDRKVRLA